MLEIIPLALLAPLSAFITVQYLIRYYKLHKEYVGNYYKAVFTAGTKLVCITKVRLDLKLSSSNLNGISTHELLPVSINTNLPVNISGTKIMGKIIGHIDNQFVIEAKDKILHYYFEHQLNQTRRPLFRGRRRK